jgi:signal transduction histidine kinase
VQLHERLGQDLTGLSFVLAGLSRTMSNEGNRAARELLSVAQSLEAIIETARTLALRLDPVATHRGNLEASLVGLRHE